MEDVIDEEEYLTMWRQEDGEKSSFLTMVSILDWFLQIILIELRDRNSSLTLFTVLPILGVAMTTNHVVLVSCWAYHNFLFLLAVSCSH